MSEHSRCLKCYLAPGRSRADRAVVARLLADRSRGISYSESVRRALRQYYGVGDRPTPPANGDLLSTVVALADEVAALRAEMREMHDALRWTLRLETHHVDMPGLQ